MKLQPANIFGIIEGYYLASVLISLNATGVFKKPGRIHSIGTFFPKHDIFRMLITRTDILQRKGKLHFTINSKYRSYMDLGFHIEKFLMAYGNFRTINKTPKIITDDKLFSQAFVAAAQFQNPTLIKSIFKSLKASVILDLGCGAGNILNAFAKSGKIHRSIGVEQNPFLIKAARASIRKNGLSKRVRIAHGNVVTFENLITKKEIAEIDVVFGSSILNEFFYTPTKLISLLKKIKRIFPGKTLIVSDYYGVFHAADFADVNRHYNLVHDFMQVLSAQGVPPKDDTSWNKYYKDADLELVHTFHGSANGINWFVHVIEI
jgi:SAM-dependent methyltransferase